MSEGMPKPAKEVAGGEDDMSYVNFAEGKPFETPAKPSQEAPSETVSPPDTTEATATHAAELAAVQERLGISPSADAPEVVPEKAAEATQESSFDFERYKGQDPAVVGGAAYEAALKNPELVNRSFLWKLAEMGALKTALELAPDDYLDGDFRSGLNLARSNAEKNGRVFHTREEVLEAFEKERGRRGIK